MLDSPTFAGYLIDEYVAALRKLYAEREKGRAVLRYQAQIAKGDDEQAARVELDSVLDALDSLEPLDEDEDTILDSIGEGARYSTGFPDLDRLSGGLTRPGLNVIAARPSVGKSALARGVIRNAARRGDTVFWYSVDQSRSQIYELEIARLEARDTGYVRGLEREQLRGLVRRVRTEVWRDRVQLIDSPQPLPMLLSMAKASGANLVVVDYLQAVPTSDDREYDAVTRISKALKNLALEMRIPVLALAQLNRDVKPNEIPSLNHLRASGQIEQDADQVWGLKRDQTDSRVDGEGEVHVLKNKTGPTGSQKLVWHAKYAEYESYPKPHQYVPGEYR